MNVKSVGYAYLAIALLTVLINVIAAFTRPAALFDEYVFISILSELIILMPLMALLPGTKSGVLKMLRIKKIKPTTALLSIVYMICCYPIAISMNMISLSVTSSRAVEMVTEEIDKPFALIFFLSAVMAPVAEELAYRGIVLGGLKTTGRIFTPILVSGLMFGLNHMNLNQFSYTMVLGIMWGLLVEASGSIFTSLICHVLINGFSTVMAFVTFDSISQIEDALGEMTQQPGLYYLESGLVLFVIGVIFLVLAMLLLKAISLNEGRSGCFENIFRRKLPYERYKSLFTPALIAGMVIMSAFVIGDTVFYLFF